MKIEFDTPEECYATIDPMGRGWHVLTFTGDCLAYSDFPYTLWGARRIARRRLKRARREIARKATMKVEVIR